MGNSRKHKDSALHRINVSFDIFVPNNINEGMICLKYNTETIERELLEHLGDELNNHEDEFHVDNISIWEDDIDR